VHTERDFSCFGVRKRYRYEREVLREKGKREKGSGKRMEREIYR